MSRRMVLTSRWRLATSAERAWETLTAPEAWPRWWPHLASARRLAAGDADGVGAVNEFRWRSGIGYDIAFVIATVRVLRMREIEGIAQGDLRGRGLWLLEDAGGEGICLTYRWAVELRRGWMRLLAPLLAPVFAWRHFAVMRGGARGLSRHLGCRLLGIEEMSSLAQER